MDSTERPHRLQGIRLMTPSLRPQNYQPLAPRQHIPSSLHPWHHPRNRPGTQRTRSRTKPTCRWNILWITITTTHGTSTRGRATSSSKCRRIKQFHLLSNRITLPSCSTPEVHRLPFSLGRTLQHRADCSRLAFSPRKPHRSLHAMRHLRLLSLLSRFLRHPHHSAGRSRPQRIQLQPKSLAAYLGILGSRMLGTLFQASNKRSTGPGL